jgi:hydroxymethylpyrimidine/phosphomethylpyrimidine kinase
MAMERRMIVLSIGTSHPWNIAGTGRDITVGAQFGVRVFSAIAAVSAQDGRGVIALHTIPDDVRAVVASLSARHWLPVVVDPVFTASSGGELANSAASSVLRDELARLGNVVLTPNLDEAATLLGSGSIDRASLGDAAAALRARGPLAVLLKGGHLDGDPADALATAEGVEIYGEPRIAGRMHGTGCTLAMALACELAREKPLIEAVRAARAFVRDEIARH